MYHIALSDQPKVEELDVWFVQGGAYALFIVGAVFVASSMWKLGITGTYLGDHCGIFMDAPVTSFPFNVVSSPMYIGSTMIFIADALMYKCPAGLVLSFWVAFAYAIATIFFE